MDEASCTTDLSIALHVERAVCVALLLCHAPREVVVVGEVEVARREVRAGELDNLWQHCCGGVCRGPRYADMFALALAGHARTGGLFAGHIGRVGAAWGCGAPALLQEPVQAPPPDDVLCHARLLSGALLLVRLPGDGLLGRVHVVGCIARIVRCVLRDRGLAAVPQEPVARAGDRGARIFSGAQRNQLDARNAEDGLVAQLCHLLTAADGDQERSRRDSEETCPHQPPRSALADAHAPTMPCASSAADGSSTRRSLGSGATFPA